MDIMRRGLLRFFGGTASALVLGVVAGYALIARNISESVRSSVKLAIKLYKQDKLVFESEYWSVTLKDDQTYVGSSTIRLKRVEEKMGWLSHEEWDELMGVVQALEFAVERAFGAVPANWYFEMSCLMNHGYKTRPPIPLVHMHFHPRHNGVVTVLGEEFRDPNYAQHYIPYTKRKVPEQVWREIIRLMQEQIKVFTEFYGFDLQKTSAI